MKEWGELDLKKELDGWMTVMSERSCWFFVCAFGFTREEESV